jgi:NAD(P)-dependent dehydrogenase (short-subunit alcohol dehydrogenase family)
MGKRALVLGASSAGGLGEAVARRLARDGADVLVAGRRMDPLRTLANELGGKAIECDVTDESSVMALAAEAGALNIAVNAAGASATGSILRTDRSVFDAQLALHVIGNFLFLKHLAPAMPRGASFTLFSSLTAQIAGPSLAAYGSAKAGLDHLVRIAAIELGGRGIRVNAVAPGFARTPMTEDFLANPAFEALYAKEGTLGKLVTPEQVAASVVYLSDDDCFVTGEILNVSGGARLGKLPRADDFKAMQQ